MDDYNLPDVVWASLKNAVACNRPMRADVTQYIRVNQAFNAIFQFNLFFNINNHVLDLVFCYTNLVTINEYLSVTAPYF